MSSVTARNARSSMRKIPMMPDILTTLSGTQGLLLGIFLALTLFVIFVMYANMMKF